MVYLLNDKIEEVIVILRSDLYFVRAVLIRLGLGASCPGQELLCSQVVHYTSVPCVVLIWHPPRYLYAWSLTRVHLPSVIQGICCSSGHCWDICHLCFDHCYSFAERASVEFFCGWPASKWVVWGYLYGRMLQWWQNGYILLGIFFLKAVLCITSRRQIWPWLGSPYVPTTQYALRICGCCALVLL